LTALTDHQVTLLQALIDFMDKQLVKFSHEKRGVAMKLTVLILQLVPVTFVSLVLSKGIVRSLFSARVNKKNTLHAIASNTIANIVKAAGDGFARFSKLKYIYFRF